MTPQQIRDYEYPGVFVQAGARSRFRPRFHAGPLTTQREKDSVAALNAADYRRHTEDIRETRGRVVDADELLQEGGKRLQPEERARLVAYERRSKIRFQVALAIAITWLVLAAARAYFAVSH